MPHFKMLAHFWENISSPSVTFVFAGLSHKIALLSLKEIGIGNKVSVK